MICPECKKSIDKIKRTITIVHSLDRPHEVKTEMVSILNGKPATMVIVKLPSRVSQCIYSCPLCDTVVAINDNERLNLISEKRRQKTEKMDLFE